MKKSSTVTLTLLAAMAASTTACRRTEVRDCTDEYQHIVDDHYCAQAEHYGGYSPYRWIYGGRSGGSLGDTVVGGSATPTAGTSSVSGRSVSRGGFGSGFSAGE